MAENILLKCDSSLGATYVPNTFIDDYMTHADGEFVKIYLYLLRCMSDANTTFSIPDTADKFDNTERDVKRALKYWEKMHLLRLEFDKQEELTSICLLDISAPDAASAPAVPAALVTAAVPAPPPEPAVTIQLPPRTEYSKNQLSQFTRDECVQELLFVAEQYIGRILSHNDIQSILYWLDKLHFSQDLIEYLIEQCVSKNHKSIRYMDKVAQAWAQQGIHTLAQAKEHTELHNSTVHAVKKAFGISGRSLVDFEREYVDKWSASMGFSDTIIACACQRTIRSTHQISFEYADKILSRWKAQNVCSQKDIALLDAQYQEAQKSVSLKSASSHTAQGTTVSNRFSNFEQRTYDYDALEKDLLNR